MPNSLLSLFPGTGREGPTRLGELSRERRGGGQEGRRGARWVGGGRDRKDVSSSLPLPRFFFLFFFTGRNRQRPDLLSITGGG